MANLPGEREDKMPPIWPRKYRSIQLRDKVKPGELGILWLGQGGFAFRTSENKVVIVDPLLSFSASKDGMTYIHSHFPVDPNNIKVDYVFCTHMHGDHTDEETLTSLWQANPEANFYGPLESYDCFQRIGIPRNRASVVSLDSIVNLDGIRVQSVYAECTSKEKITHYGYLFDFGPFRIYVTGDTKVGLEGYLNKIKWTVVKKPDVLIVCINRGFSNLGPEDAARLASLVSPEIIIPMHYDCFVENTIDPVEFVNKLSPALCSRVVLMKYGEYISIKAKATRHVPDRAP